MLTRVILLVIAVALKMGKNQANLDAIEAQTNNVNKNNKRKLK